MTSTGKPGLSFTILSMDEVESLSASFVQKRRGQGWRNQTYDNREFIAWDGEGWTEHSDPLCKANLARKDGRSFGCSRYNCQHHYCLFGNSAGISDAGRSLSTLECLQVMLRTGYEYPHAIHIGFAFQYDVNMILRDLSPKYMQRLKDNTFVHWHGYRIEHIPKKWFTVSGTYKGKRVSIRIQDVFSFFATSFVKALKTWSVGSAEEIASIETGKAGRDTFKLSEVDTFIRPYWERELHLLVELGNRLRDILYSANLRITSWYGPGNVATYLYDREGTAKRMDKQLRPEIVSASQYAYAGGRFEAFKAGLHNGPVYSADINSAYPYALAQMPDLQSGKWHHTTDETTIRAVPTRVGLYRVEFMFNHRMTMRARENGFPFPVFNRRSDGQVWYPEKSKGWYHAPEFRQLLRVWEESKGRAFSSFRIVEAWIYEDDGSYPFEWVAEMYDQRAQWKREGNPAEKALKLGLNSLYGKLAQRIGSKDNESPKWHQLEWAGAITATARGMLYEVMLNNWDSLIGVETDGIYATSPILDLPNGTGNALGQWEVEEYSGMLFLQNGVYWLRDSNGDWLPPKSRGIPQSHLSFDAAMESLRSGTDLVAFQSQFIGYGTALHRDPRRMSKWRTWTVGRKQFEFGGNGKRFHSPKFCPQCKAGMGTDEGLHTLSLRLSHPAEWESHRHRLPWTDELYEGNERLKEELRWEIIGDD